jgi:hypothetical protein
MFPSIAAIVLAVILSAAFRADSIILTNFKSVCPLMVFPMKLG